MPEKDGYRVLNRTVEQRCYKCKGTGWLKHRCAPNRVNDHPFNERELKQSWGIGKYVALCGCGMFWLMYYECGDDSWDVPDPEPIGYVRPAEDYDPNECTPNEEGIKR
jgi:hypothetical protein